MSSIEINGPVVDADTHNMVLKDVLFHSPVARAASSTSYHRIEVGLRSGAYTTYVGTWDQSAQKIEAGTPSSILDADRLGMRLVAGQAVVVRVTAIGTPSSLAGSRLTFTTALVGGRDGIAKPLVSAGSLVTDVGTRTAFAALERQINTGGLNEWDEPVQLQDPIPLATVGTFQGRLQRDSATQISLQRYNGNWVDVNGTAMSIGSSGLTFTTSDLLLSSTGGSASTPSSSTLYYAYVGSFAGDAVRLKLSATAPTSYLGIYYLGSDERTSRWRFAGWARTNASTQFSDDSTDRLVVNYYNREWKNVLLRPAYNDNNASTTYTTTSTTWTAANGGTGATASYVANGEDGLHVTAFALVANSGAGSTRIGIGDNSGTTCVAETGIAGTAGGAVLAIYSATPATGYRTLVLLVSVSSGTGTYGADDARNGSATDPVATGLCTTVPV